MSIPKMSTMITSAIRHLRQSQGSTPKEIMNYIISRYNLESPRERQMKAALKRGLNCGILDRNRGHYKLNAIAEYILQMGKEPKKSVQRGAKRQRRSMKGKKRKYQTVTRNKGGSSIRSTIGPFEERCRCMATRPKNAYTLESNIPSEQQEQRRKDVVCCFKKKWKEKCDNESTDQSRSTLGSNPEISEDQEKI
ncbi:histone H5-like [Vespula squamosa]|uniref:Histone H5-like n=1 Tax=Vespula squamosa TaxID=30214 RepID=A0ABD2AY58_VESSQ